MISPLQNPFGIHCVPCFKACKVIVIITKTSYNFQRPPLKMSLDMLARLLSTGEKGELFTENPSWPCDYFQVCDHFQWHKPDKIISMGSFLVCRAMSGITEHVSSQAEALKPGLQH